jgi:hypothetical protein
MIWVLERCQGTPSSIKKTLRDAKQHWENSKIWFLGKRKTLGKDYKKKHQISLSNVREMLNRCQVTLKKRQAMLGTC